MSEERDQSRRMMGTGEIVRTNSAHHLAVGFALGGRLNSCDSEIVNSHTKQIKSLRREIEERDEAISRLDKDVKELRGENDDLKITVESKDQEIKALKDKINKLETEKKALEMKLRSVEVELEAMKKEVVEIKEANKIREERNTTLEIKVERLTKKMDGMTKNHEESRSENTTLKKEVKDLREEMASFEVPVRMGLPLKSDPSTPATKIEAFMYLGALCDLVQTMMYRCVFRDTFHPEAMYKVKDIKAELPKAEAIEDKRWVDLKEELNWNWKHLHAITHCKRIRNKCAHPTAAQLTKESLEISIELLKREGSLEGALSLEVVNELKNMWEKLKLKR